VPEEVIAAGHVEEWIGWTAIAADGYRLPVVVAVTGYGNAAEFRDGLTGRGLHHVVAARSEIGPGTARTSRFRRTIAAPIGHRSRATGRRHRTWRCWRPTRRWSIARSPGGKVSAAR
jgi:hypothetical protein